MSYDRTPIIITNVLPTRTSFGVTDNGAAESVFIPSRVSTVCDLAVGQRVEASLVPNSREPERTPWLAIHISLDGSDISSGREQWELVKEKVRGVMSEGGVWTAETMADQLSIKEEKEKNQVVAALHSLFAHGECAKFQMWRKPDYNKPDCEWFTMFPDNVEVDEWVDEDVFESV